MSSSKVSSNFTKFLAKNSQAVQAAKEAENTMQTCAMPVGWKGQVVCTGAEADKGKDRKDDKGNTVEGKEFIRLDFNVINDPQYQGKKCSIIWVFFDSEKATSADRFEWCLNEMENLGLPRELRTGFNDISEILDYFTTSDEVYSAEVVHNAYRRGDQKEVKVRREQAVDSSSDMAPASSTSSSPSPSPSPSSKPPKSAGPSYTVGQDVKYLGKLWELVAIEDEVLVVKSKVTGNSRQVHITDIEA